MNRITGKGMYLFMVAALIMGLALVAAPLPVGANGNTHPLATPFEGNVAPSGYTQKASASVSGLTSVSDVVDMNTVLARGANYLKHAQADVTEDNAGNGNPDADPNDGGWDWVLTSPVFTHSPAASPVNLYGATAMGLYYAYLKTPNAGYMTAMQDAATRMVGDAGIRTASDIIFLMNFQDLPGVTADIYKAAAKSKFDARIVAYGSATAFAQYIRDNRALTQGYKNGIVPWSIAGWAVAAQMLEDRYPAEVYDYATAADDIAEVLWQDSFNNSPGYFVPGTNNGWDPTYTNSNYWWYSLGITGLLDAFQATGVHTDAIPGLVTILLNCQYPGGAFSGSYGAHENDEDWQSTAYAVMSLAQLDRPTYQTQINRAAYWLAATQDVASGGWLYSDSTHYPEVGGENTSAFYFAVADLAPVTTDPLICVGEKTTVNLDLANIANLYGYQFEVAYNKDMASAEGAFVDSFFDTAHNAYSDPDWKAVCTAGTCKFSVVKTDPGVAVSFPSGTLATIVFTGVAPGVFPVTIGSDATLTDRDGEALARNVAALPLTVCGSTTVSGKVTLQGRSGGNFDDGTVTLTDLGGNFPGPFNVVFGNDGLFSLNVPVMPLGSSYQMDAAHPLYLTNRKTPVALSYGVTLASQNTRLWGGDANNNGEVKIGDLSCIGSSFGKVPPGDCTGGSADINADGKVNVQDLAIAGGNFDKFSPLTW